MNYDYEKENYKTCPVCGKTIDYHVDGFYHDKVLNVWICRDHKLKEIEQHIKLQDQETIDFIREKEEVLLCARCAGREPITELESDLIFELKPCIKCGNLTAKEEGAVVVSVRQKLISQLEELSQVVKKLWDLYEENAPSSANDFAPSELDSLDLTKIFPMSLDEWFCEITAKIDELKMNSKQ